MKKRLLRIALDINSILTKTGNDLLDELVAFINQNPNAKLTDDVINKVDEAFKANTFSTYSKDKVNALEPLINAELKVKDVKNLPGHQILMKKLNQINGTPKKQNGQVTEQDISKVSQHFSIPKQYVTTHLVEALQGKF